MTLHGDGLRVKPAMTMLPGSRAAPGPRPRWFPARPLPAAGNAASKCARSLPISSTSTASFAHVRGRVAQQRADEIHAVGAAGQRQRGLGPVFGGQLRHAVRVHVGRVAQDQVVRARARRRRPSDSQQADAVLQAVLVDVDAGDFQRVGRDVGGVHRARPGRPWPPARPGCRCRCTGPARVRVRSPSQGSMLPSASSSAMKLRGTMARSST